MIMLSPLFLELELELELRTQLELEDVTEQGVTEFIAENAPRTGGVVRHEVFHFKNKTDSPPRNRRLIGSLSLRSCG
jgi:hypothetical protein